MNETKRVTVAVSALCLSVALTACGGSEDTTPTKVAASPLEPQRIAMHSSPTDEAFFAFTMRNWPQFFHGASTDGWIGTYHFRHFSETKNYVAISLGMVFVLGEVTGGQLVAVSPVASFACGVDPSSCLDERTSSYSYINEVRNAGGFEALLQDRRVEAAAQSHSEFVTRDYVVNGAFAPIFAATAPNGAPFGHWETTGHEGYTGATTGDRLRAASFTSVYEGEVIAGPYGDAPDAEPTLQGCIDTWLNSVFHRAALLDTAVTSVGFGIGSAVRDPHGYVMRVCVLDLGAEGNIHTMPAGWSGVYPYSGQFGVSTTMAPGEVPDPVPSYLVKGIPISIQVPTWYTLSLTSFTVSDSGGRLVEGTTITRSQSPFLRTNEAYFVPNGALAPNSTYTVAFAGVANGTQPGQLAFALDRSWSFTTGAK